MAETNKSIEELLDSIEWCEPWKEPIVSEDARQLLIQCQEESPTELSSDIQELIENSNRFPCTFPVHNARLEKLISNTPEERLRRNVASTYPLLHERVLVLMANFLLYKRKYGSNIEKELYKDMSIPQLIDRFLLKRAVCFIKTQDQYKLITGDIGVDGWESIGTDSEKPPLVLAQCLSYDEVKLSALMYVSGYTECINDGTRYNAGVLQDNGVEREAVIIGIVGPRFKRLNRMEFEDIVVTEEQNTAENGYGEHDDASDPVKRMWRQLWEDFYQIPSVAHEDLEFTSPPAESSDENLFSERFIHVWDREAVFDNLVYYRRLQLIFNTVLLEANERAKEADNFAFVNIIGAGLGVWRMSRHQDSVYVAALVQRIHALLMENKIQYVSDVNLAYIDPGPEVSSWFKVDENNGGLFKWFKWRVDKNPPKKLFLKNASHPKGGINVQMQNREPSSLLQGDNSRKVLVMTYPWDGNAHPGNEFWFGNLRSSGDPAAACSTQVAELHNAHINPILKGSNARFAGNTVQRLSTLQLTDNKNI